MSLVLTPTSDAVSPAMTSAMVRSPIAVRRLARWRRHGVLYEVHCARLAGGATGIVVSALGPGRRHRFALMPDEFQTVHLRNGWSASDVELTAVAEALLGAHVRRSGAGVDRSPQDRDLSPLTNVTP